MKYILFLLMVTISACSPQDNKSIQLINELHDCREKLSQRDYILNFQEYDLMASLMGKDYKIVNAYHGMAALADCEGAALRARRGNVPAFCKLSR